MVDIRSHARTVLDSVKIYVYEEGKEYQHIHLKRDGWCMYVCRDFEGKMHMLTKNLHHKTCDQEWSHNLERLKPGEWVLGELYVPGGTSQEVSSVLKEEPSKEGEFEVFYVPYVHTMEGLFEWCDDHYLNAVGLCSAADLTTIPEGYEGYVLKNTYHPNVPYGWMKHKPIMTADVRITDFKRAKEGKWDGLIGSYYAKTDDGYISCWCSGMSEELMKDMTAHPEKYLNKVVEVHYQLRYVTGKIRHPRFIRIREDKDTTDAGT